MRLEPGIKPYVRDSCEISLRRFIPLIGRHEAVQRAQFIYNRGY